MCQISINLNYTTPVGTAVVSATGRYRLVGSFNWTSFTNPINLTDPKTPNITQVGNYELEVRVTNSAGTVSSWAASTFQVTNDCGDNDCRRYRITNQSVQGGFISSYINCDPAEFDTPLEIPLGGNVVICAILFSLQNENGLLVEDLGLC